jgi:hypothetical protein
MKALGHGWATPVVSKRSALWASVLFAVSRVTGYRVLNHRKHLAWERACGLPKP